MRRGHTRASAPACTNTETLHTFPVAISLVAHAMLLSHRSHHFCHWSERVSVTITGTVTDTDIVTIDHVTMSPAHRQSEK